MQKIWQRGRAGEPRRGTSAGALFGKLGVQKGDRPTAVGRPQRRSAITSKCLSTIRKASIPLPAHRSPNIPAPSRSRAIVIPRPFPTIGRVKGCRTVARLASVQIQEGDHVVFPSLRNRRHWHRGLRRKPLIAPCCDPLFTLSVLSP